MENQPPSAKISFRFFRPKYSTPSSAAYRTSKKLVPCVVELDSTTSHSASPFYPLRRFYSTTSEGFYSFHNAAMTKFSQDKLLRIETLKLSV
ncbi:hypothetical protein LINPERPRIM_LOCUS12044 [Linum perenne]